MKRLPPLLISLVLLGLIYWRIDFAEVPRVFALSDPAWLLWALLVLVPLVALMALRLRLLVPKQTGVGLAEATRLILAASVLNVILPSKMGDLAKSWFFRQRGHLSGSLALALVIFEKASDLLALLAWCGFGLILLHGTSVLLTSLAVLVSAGVVMGLLLLGSHRFAGMIFRAAGRLFPVSFADRLERLHESWVTMQQYVWADRRRLLIVVSLSLLIWFVNLFEVWMFLQALRAPVPLLDSLGLTPLAILAGLLPLTFAGIGTRDAALIFFYRDYLAAPAGAALGLLLMLRYVLLGLAGAPFLGTMSRRA